MRTLSVGRITSIRVPTAPLVAQSQMVASVENQAITIDVIQTRQNETQADLDALLPAILDRAFTGEL
ncbi:MAG: hypothetical protein IT337_15050 [Thermomicrobiales bacterium]|nr:hypothetical protein [Thermomicrobiales bacterium]